MHVKSVWILLKIVFRTLLGSVSDYIVHNCPCTVIVTKAEPLSHHEERRKSIVSLTSNMDNTK